MGKKDASRRPWHCCRCGSTNIFKLAWIDPNAPEGADVVVDDKPSINGLNLAVAECQQCGRIVRAFRSKTTKAKKGSEDK